MAKLLPNLDSNRCKLPVRIATATCIFKKGVALVPEHVTRTCASLAPCKGTRSGGCERKLGRAGILSHF